MPIELDHTIVPARDKVRAARFFARIFGLPFEDDGGHFAAVQVNDRLTLDFADSENFGSHHYAFKVSEQEFNEIFGHIEAEGITFGSGPRALEDMQINRRGRGRGVYFRDPDGHVLELLTVG
ncbi:MAG: VOC family protein [Gammaproteobacteria bacterium]|nr:VOC family protein [Gammaproteobacteria bacterium]